MTPRTVVATAPESMSLKEFYQDGKYKFYSRIPIYNDSEDYITGYVLRQTVLEKLAEDRFDMCLKDVARPILSFPENSPVSTVWEQMLEKKEHISILIDEYGCFWGIVTMEDIIEEIVGEINDEYDEDERQYVRLNANTYVFEAKVLLTDFFRIMKLDDDFFEEVEGEADTLAGLLLEIKGEFPERHEVIKYKNYCFEVLEMDDRRILKIKVTVESPETSDEV